MKKNFTPFERNLREKMEGHEMPYEPASWASLQRQMGMAKSGNSVWIVSLISTILALSGGAIALYRHQHTTTFAQKASTSERFVIGVTNTTKGVSHSANQATSTVSIESSNSTVNVNAAPVSAATHDGVTYFTLNEVNTGITTQSAESVVSTNQPSQSGSLSNAPKPDNIIEFACNVRKACRGEEVDFQTTNGPKTGSYLWNFGDGHFSDDINPKHKFAKAGHYDVSLSITSDNGQINTTVVNDMITIEDAPDADFGWEFINTNPSAPEVRIVNLTEGGNTYEWSNGTESKVITDGATFVLQNAGRQMIALNAKNEAGCADGAVKHISVNSDFALGAPAQWSTADGAFMPQGLKKSKVDFVLSIYDQAGNRIFETSSRIKGWDGKLPSGATAATGSTFSYKVIISNDHSQEQKYFFGTFNVFP
jgi:PKD repeat protein